MSAEQGRTTNSDTQLGILQLSKNRIVFLEIRDLDNPLFSTAYLKQRIYPFLSTTTFRSTQWPSG